VLLGIGFAAPVAGVVWWGWPLLSLAGLLALPLCVSPARRVLRHADPRELLPALGETARVVAVFGLLLGAGLAFGG